MSASKKQAPELEPRWQYRFVSLQLMAKNPEEVLNRYGDEGWEAVAIRLYADVDGMPYMEAVFKRPRREG